MTKLYARNIGLDENPTWQLCKEGDEGAMAFFDLSGIKPGPIVKCDAVPTLRDRFAMAAIPSCLCLKLADAAKRSYEVADAMMKARDQ